MVWNVWQALTSYLATPLPCRFSSTELDSFRMKFTAEAPELDPFSDNQQVPDNSFLGRNSEVSGDAPTTLVFTQELDPHGTGVMDIRHLGRCWE